MITIWAIMLTGGSDARIMSARNSLKQLHAMVPAGKGVQYATLILNQHDTLKVLDGSNCQNAREVHIDRRLPHLRTLGSVRNFGLTLIPNGDFIYVFDDDDYRHPDLLHTMWETMQSESKRPTMIQITNRLNYNLATGGCWQSTHRHGLVHFLGSIDELRAQKFAYNDTDTLEDISIYALHNRLLFDNEAAHYVRYTHGQNASVWVNPRQKEAQLNTGLYVETALKPDEEKELKEYCIKNCPIDVKI